METKTLSSLDMYMRRVYKLVVLFTPAVALCAGLTFTVIKLLGFYNFVPWGSLILFDLACLVYFVLGLIFVGNGEQEDGGLKPRIVKRYKIFMFFVEIIQWNFITYLIPSRDFWAYSIFFVMLVTLLLDSKFVLIVSAEIGISLIVSWFILPDQLLPVKDDMYIPNIIIRCVLIMLSFSCLWLVTYLVENKLVKELERIADHDELTKLRNRRALEKYIGGISRQKDVGELAFIICDLDNLKKINDVCGAEKGDELLKKFADIIEDCDGDFVPFRYVGDEFLLVCRGNEEYAVEIAEKLRRDVIKLGSVGNYDITLTLGIEMFDPEVEIENLIKRADAKMYYGKQNGKNQVVV